VLKNQKSGSTQDFAALFSKNFVVKIELFVLFLFIGSFSDLGFTVPKKLYSQKNDTKRLNFRRLGREVRINRFTRKTDSFLRSLGYSSLEYPSLGYPKDAWNP